MSKDCVRSAAEDGGVRRPAAGPLPEMQVLTGAVGSTSSRERSHSEIQIVIPGERQLPRSCIGHPKEGAAASDERAADLDHSAGQPHQLLCARGTDLTVVRIASDLLKRIARESGHACRGSRRAVRQPSIRSSGISAGQVRADCAATANWMVRICSPLRWC